MHRFVVLVCFSLVLPKLSESSCSGNYTYPDLCEPIDSSTLIGTPCQYELYYTVTPQSHVEFTVTTLRPSSATTDEGFWSGIGFNAEKAKMDKGYTVLLKLDTYDNSSAENTAPTEYIMTGYGTPAAVESQKSMATNSSMKFVDGGVTMSFSLHLVPPISSAALNLNISCVYLLYPISGGPVKSSNLRRHAETPTVSSEKVCFMECQNGDASMNEGDTTKGSETTNESTATTLPAAAESSTNAATEGQSGNQESSTTTLPESTTNRADSGIWKSQILWTVVMMIFLGKILVKY